MRQKKRAGFIFQGANGGGFLFWFRAHLELPVDSLPKQPRPQQSTDEKKQPAPKREGIVMQNVVHDDRRLFSDAKNSGTRPPMWRCGHEELGRTSSAWVYNSTRERFI